MAVVKAPPIELKAVNGSAILMGFLRHAKKCLAKIIPAIQQHLLLMIVYILLLQPLFQDTLFVTTPSGVVSIACQFDRFETSKYV